MRAHQSSDATPSSTSSLEIRPIARGDLAEVTASLPLQRFAPANKHEERLKLQQSGAAVYLVAWREGVPVGHAFVHLVSRSDEAQGLGCAELEDMKVSEAARGQGIGLALLKAAEEEVRAAGGTSLGLAVTVSNPDNAAARRLYERAGYRDVGLGESITGYTYWDELGEAHRDEEPHHYLVKNLG